MIRSQIGPKGAYHGVHQSKIRSPSQPPRVVPRKQPMNKFPQFREPHPSDFEIIRDGLVELHGKPVRMTDPLSELNDPLAEGHNQITVLDSLVRTILSQNTTDKTSIRAFKKLKDSFPEWEDVRTAAPDKVMDAIREGGLSEVKTERIKMLLNYLKEERGECCLEWLRDKDTDFVKGYLGQFKGVGPKTISCTLMFAMNRDDFPVDTHVLRISKDLSWIPKSASREDAYVHLNERVPDHIKYDLHVLLVAHGKVCSYCSSRKSGSVDASECPIKILKAVRRVKQEIKEEEEEEIIVSTGKKQRLK